jgi:hypothetical protein
MFPAAAVKFPIEDIAARNVRRVLKPKAGYFGQETICSRC